MKYLTIDNMTLLPRKVTNYLDDIKNNNIKEAIDDSIKVYVVKDQMYVYANDIPVHKFDAGDSVLDVIKKLNEVKSLSHELKLRNQQ
jgi:hypothetical protein